MTIPQNITKLLSGVDGLNSTFYNMLMIHISILEKSTGEYMYEKEVHKN